MAVARTGGRIGSSWLVWAFSAGGAALLLVELNAGMGYVEAGLQQNMGNVLGWAPAVGMITLKMAEQSIWHWGALEVALRGVPLAAMGLLLVTLGLLIHKQAGGGRRQMAKGRQEKQV